MTAPFDAWPVRGPLKLLVGSCYAGAILDTPQGLVRAEDCRRDFSSLPVPLTAVCLTVAFAL